MRRVKRRRPYFTIIVLGLLAVVLVWVLVPLVRGERIPDPLGLVGRFFPGNQVFAAEQAEEDEGDDTPAAPDEGKVRVLISGREISAYNKVVRDDVINRFTGNVAFMDVDEDFVESSGIFVDAADIVGRVIAHTKAAGYPFTEKDFLPKGTRPGLSAGVPAGKRALRIDVDTVHGIVGLQPGDRFDMAASVPLGNNSSAGQPAFAGVYSSLLQRQTQLNNYPRAKVDILVQNGVVVTGLETRDVPITNSSLTRGTTVKTIPKQEMVIALDPDEVAPLLEAMGVDAQIQCLARSGHPDDDLGSLTPSSEPQRRFWDLGFGLGGSDGTGHGDQEDMAVVEAIDDQERTLIPTRSAGAEKP